MKKTICVLACFGSSFSLFSQTHNLKNSLNFGGGFENYHGDMGNTYFVRGEEVYGFFHLDYARYLSKSFDVDFRVNAGEIGRCLDGDEVLEYQTNFMMRARLTSGQILMRYKLANGYILPENAVIAPFIHAGVGLNYLQDIWTHSRVNEGFYGSFNAGLGLQYHISPRYHFTYQLGFGYFNSDEIDFKVAGHKDRYMQNTFTLGLNF